MYIHTCTCIGDTWTHSHNTIRTQTYTHSDTHITQTYVQHTHTHTLGQTRHHPHTCTYAHTERHTCADTCVHTQTQMHTRHTHTRTHTCAQTPAQGMMMPFALGRKVLGAERQRNGGWGSETSVFLSVESPQHLGAGTREEQQRWGGGGFGRRADSSGCVGSREVSRESARPLGHTGVLARAQEDQFRLRGVRGCSRPGGPPGGGAQS